MGSFKSNSYVRAGFISRTGMLGYMVYESARDNGYSSFMFVEKDLRCKDHSLARITKLSDDKPVIDEWTKIPLDLFNAEKLTDFDNKEHMLVYDINVYYLKNTIHILVLMDKLVMSENSKVVKIYLEMCLFALQLISSID